MNDMQFYEYVLSLLTDAGHVITSIPIYANHTSNEALYIDSTNDILLNRFERRLLSSMNNISLLAEIKWSGVVDELNENVQIYSITVNFSEYCRSQNIADIHHLMQKYWDCTHSIVFFKNYKNYIVSFADNDSSHILSDWRKIEIDYDDIVDIICVENISFKTSDEYFFDFLYSIAREYCIRPISFEEAYYGLMPIDYINKKLTLDSSVLKYDIKEMIRSNLFTFETLYGDDYVEPMYIETEESDKYNIISDEINRISFELEIDEDVGNDQLEKFDFEDYEDFVEDKNGEGLDDYDDNIDPTIFEDPVLMIKWLERKERERDDNDENNIIDRLEQGYLHATDNEHDLLKIDRQEQEQINVKRRQVLTILNQVYNNALLTEQKRIEIEENERVMLANKRIRLQIVLKEILIIREKQEHLEAICQEQERIQKEKQYLFSQIKNDHLIKLKYFKSQYISENKRINKELSEIEKIIQEKNTRLSNLSFIRFFEKRSLKSDLKELEQKKQDLLTLMQNIESNYEEQCEREYMEFNMLLAEKSITID